MAGEPTLTPIDQWRRFLEDVPSYRTETILNLIDLYGYADIGGDAGALTLYCECDGGVRRFDLDGGRVYVEHGKAKFSYLSYFCRDCRQSRKTYAVAITRTPPVLPR